MTFARVMSLGLLGMTIVATGITAARESRRMRVGVVTKHTSKARLQRPGSPLAVKIIDGTTEVFEGDSVSGPKGTSLHLRQRNGESYDWKPGTRARYRESSEERRLSAAITALPAAVKSRSLNGLKWPTDIPVDPTRFFIRLDGELGSSLDVKVESLGQPFWSGRLTRDDSGHFVSKQLSVALAKASSNSDFRLLLKVGEATEEVKFELLGQHDAKNLNGIIAVADQKSSEWTRGLLRIEAFAQSKQFEAERVEIENLLQLRPDTKFLVARLAQLCEAGY